MTAHILLIEADSTTRAFYAVLLRQEGHQVSEATSGDDGLSIFDCGGVDIVVVGRVLPGVNGLELTRQLRRASDVPLAILSARTCNDDIVAGLEAGADDYLTRPVSAKDLSTRVRALVRRARLVPPPNARAIEPPREREIGTKPIEGQAVVGTTSRRLARVDRPEGCGT